MIESVYKNKKGDIFELWTSKHGTPYIIRCRENGEAVLSFEFSSIEERAEAINNSVAKGKIYKAV